MRTLRHLGIPLALAASVLLAGCALSTVKLPHPDAPRSAAWDRGHGEMRLLGFAAALPDAPGSCVALDIHLPAGTSALKLRFLGNPKSDAQPGGAGVLNATAISPSGAAIRFAVDPSFDGGGPLDQALATERHLDLRDPEAGTWRIEVRPLSPVVNQQGQLFYEAHGASAEPPAPSLLSRTAAPC
jgi:hypothetical protein